MLAGAVRPKFRRWVAERLKIDPGEVWLPESMTTRGSGLVHPAHPRDRRIYRGQRIACIPVDRAGKPRFLETVEFTAVDFLGDDAERDTEIHAVSARRSPSSFGVTASRTFAACSVAFRSTSCHWRPGPSTHLPFTKTSSLEAGSCSCRFAGRARLGGLVLGLRSIHQVVHEILHPQVDRQRVVPSDTYWAALQDPSNAKACFMGSLWLRARFDVEYLGLPLPDRTPSITGSVAHGNRPGLYRGDAPRPDHRRTGPSPAPETAGMGGEVARPFWLDL